MQKTCYEGFTCELTSRGAAGRTIEAYLYDLTQFFRYHGLPFKSLSESELSQITPAHIQNFLSSMMSGGARFSTLRRNLASLRRFFDYVVASGFMNDNPAGEIRLASLAQEPISEEKLLALFQKLSRRERIGGDTTRLRDQLILFFMLFLGVRAYRIPKLTLESLEKWEYGLALRLGPKRSAPIDGVILQRLHEYLKLRGAHLTALFNAAGRERPIAASAVHDLLVSASRLIELDLTPMLIRQTSLWLQNSPERSNEILQKIAAGGD